MPTTFWEEAEILKILKTRLGPMGQEYLVEWKSSHRPTWELRSSFFTTKILDAFDQKIREKAALPILTCEQQYQRQRLRNQQKPKQKVKDYPKSVTGCIENAGSKFALVEYYSSPQLEFVKWDKFQKHHPDLAKNFIESRCLKEVLQ